MSRSRNARKGTGKNFPRTLGRVMNKSDRQREHQRRRQALKREVSGAETKLEPTWLRWNWWAYSRCPCGSPRICH